MSRPGPEIPYPFPLPPEFPIPPEHPTPSSPPWVPMVDDPYSVEPRQRLYEQRRLLVNGPLDAAHVATLVATLMALDGLYAAPVELVVASPGGPITEALSLLDVIGLMRAPVDVLCIAPTAGTAAILVACASGRRRATPNATLSLRCAYEHTLHGSVSEINTHSAELLRVQTALARRVCAATGQPVEVVREWLDTGPALSGPDAVAAGLLDEVIETEASR